MSQTRVILQTLSVTALAGMSRGQEGAVRADREQATAHQIFLFVLQLKWFVSTFK